MTMQAHLQVDARTCSLRASSVGELVLDVVLVELDQALPCRFAGLLSGDVPLATHAGLMVRQQTS